MQKASTPFKTASWTTVALQVLATAKHLGSGCIQSRHLLLACEAGDGLASRILKRLSVSPSAVFGTTAPKALIQESDLYYEDFSTDFREIFPHTTFAEAKITGCPYVGSEHLLLMLAKTGVPGASLSYDFILKTVFDLYREAEQDAAANP
jgi:hypothetical protein